MTVNLQTPAVSNTHASVTIDGEGRGEFSLPTDEATPTGPYGLRCWAPDATRTGFTTWTVR